MADKTWCAIGAENWNVAANWDPVGVPADDDNVIFAGAACGDCAITVDTNSLGTFSINAGYTGIITQTGGNVTCTDFTTASGTFTGSASYTLTCSGNLTCNTGATVTDFLLRVIMSGGNIAGSKRILFSALTISENCEILTTPGNTEVDDLTINSAKTLTLSGGGSYGVAMFHTVSPTYSNSGIINGTNNLTFALKTSATVTFGTVNCPMVIWTHSGSSASQTITLGANTTFGSTLTISSAHATYTCTLSHGTNYTLEVTGLTTLSTRGLMTQGTGLWTFTGGLTINGTSALFTMGGNITCTGDFTVTTGTFTGVTTSTVTCGGNFTQTGGTITLWVLRIILTKDGGLINVGATQTSLYSCQYSNNITITATTAWAQQILTIDSGKTVTINSGSNLAWWAAYAVSAFTNSGTVAGTGTLTLYGGGGANTSNTIIFGTVNSLVSILSAAVNYTFNIGANATLGSTLNVSNSAGTVTNTLSHGTNYTLTVTGLTTLGIYGIMTQGTGLWSFNGGITINGTSALYTQGGNVSVTGVTTLTTGTLTGNISYTWTCLGNLTHTNVIVTASLLCLIFNSLNAILNAGQITIYALTANDSMSLTFASAWILTSQLTVASGKTFTINTAGKIFGVTSKPTTTFLFSNSGTIAGAGSLYIDAYQNCTVTFGTVNTPVVIEANAASSASSTVSLGTNTTLGSTLTIDSANATYTCILSHGTNYTLGITGLTTLGARGIATQGTGTWTCTAGLTINGTSAQYTQAGAISTTTVTVTLGTFSVGGTTTGNLTLNGGLVNMANNGGITGTTTITSGTITGNLSYIWTQNGNFTYSGGTFTPGVFNLIMSGSNKTINTDSAGSSQMYLNSLTINDDTTWSGTGVSAGIALQIVGKDLVIASNKTLTVASGKIFGYCPYLTSPSFTNSGAIAGEGTFSILMHISDMTITFGTITAPTQLTTTTNTAASRIITFGANTSFGSTLSILSGHATFSLTINHGTNYTLGVTGLTTLGVRGTITQGTGLFTFSAGLTINGTSALFTQGGNVSITGTTTVTLGTLTGNASYTWTQTGNFTWNGGTITNTILNLIMNSAGAIISNSSGLSFIPLSIQFSANTTLSLSNLISCTKATTDTGITVSNSSSISYYHGFITGWIWNNLGTWGGTKAVIFQWSSTAIDATITFGVINNPVILDAANATKTCSLGANTSFGSTLSIILSWGTGGLTLLHGTNYTLTVTGLTTLGAYGIMTQGSGTWTFTGGLTQSGANSVFTQGGDITMTGNMTVSNGTFTPSSSYTLSAYGNVTISDGTLNSGMNLYFHGTSKIFTTAVATSLKNLAFYGTTTVTYTGSGTITVSASLWNQPNMEMIISSGTILSYTGNAGGSLTLQANIIGDGTLNWNSTAPPNANLGSYVQVAFTVSSPLTLLGNASLGSTMALTDNLNGSGYTLSVTGVTMLTSGIMTQGSGTFTFGSIIVDGTFTQGGAVTSGSITITGIWTSDVALTINCSGSWDSSAGTFVRSTSILTLTGTGDLTTASDTDGDFATLRIDTSGTITLQSDIYVRNGYYRSSTVDLNGYHIYCYPVITSVSWSDYSITVNEYSTAFCNMLELPEEAIGITETVILTINSIEFSLTPNDTYLYWTRKIQGREISEGSLASIGSITAENSVGTDTMSMTILHITVGAITRYSNMLNNAQASIIDLLTTDETILSYTSNVLDGIPTTLFKGTGFPYIIVHTPTLNEERYTQTKMKNILTFTIEIYDKKEGNVRRIGDAVRNCLFNEQAQLRERRLTHMVTRTSSLTREFLPDEHSTPVWIYALQPEFRWVAT